MTLSVPLPASLTKHVDVLRHAFPGDPTAGVELVQRSAQDPQAARTAGDGGTGTTGTTLWLGAQVMAAYIGETTLGKGKKRVLELGGGVGYLATYLAYLGHDVTTTDVEPALSSVLLPNVATNLGAFARTGGTVAVVPLDWKQFLGANGDAVSSAQTWTQEALDSKASTFDSIITTDTIYDPSLIEPLLCTLRAFSSLAGPAQRSAPILVALERRDPGLVDSALAAASEMGFDVVRVGPGRVAKCLAKAGWGTWLRVARCASVREGGCSETEEDEDADRDDEDDAPPWVGKDRETAEEPQPDRAAWAGVEIWQFRYRGPRSQA